MFSRPSDSGHTPFGDIFYSESPDMIHWGCHPKVEKVIGRVQRLEPDLYQLETKEGRFLIYYGVLTSCNGFVYSMGAAILDIDNHGK